LGFEGWGVRLGALGWGVWGLRFGAWGLGLGTWGLGLGACCGVSLIEKSQEKATRSVWINTLQKTHFRSHLLWTTLAQFHQTCMQDITKTT